jgi:transcriptional regulator with XRE-family HTH domain
VVAVIPPDQVAADLIREIRKKSGLSQADLAHRAGMPASVLSAYEHGRRQPSVGALVRVARAAELDLQLSDLPDEAALQRSARVLLDVLDLADRMPSRDRGELKYPPLIELAS